LCHIGQLDERYDEENFRFQSSIEAVRNASMVIVVGTTGATSLPMHIGTMASQRGVPMLVVNLEPNSFSEMVRRSGRGAFLQGTAGEWVPHLVDALPAR